LWFAAAVVCRRSPGASTSCSRLILKRNQRGHPSCCRSSRPVGGAREQQGPETTPTPIRDSRSAGCRALPQAATSCLEVDPMRGARPLAQKTGSAAAVGSLGSSRGGPGGTVRLAPARCRAGLLGLGRLRPHLLQPARPMSSSGLIRFTRLTGRCSGGGATGRRQSCGLSGRRGKHKPAKSASSIIRITSRRDRSISLPALGETSVRSSTLGLQAHQHGRSQERPAEAAKSCS